MDAASFRKALKTLGDTHDEASYLRAEREFQRYSPEEWVAWILLRWPDEARRQRRITRAWSGLAVLFFVGAIVVTVLGYRRLQSVLIMAMCATNLWRSTVFRRNPTPSALITPLLMRLDDVALVPLWLEYLCLVSGTRRAVFLMRLAEHLPAWHESGEPLPECARTVLLREVRQLSGSDWTPETPAFLTAALVSLDSDPSRGVPADVPTLWALQTLRHRESDDRVRAAAEDALQRLGRS